MRVCDVGLYFADAAAYSHLYASRADPQKKENDLKSDEREMMLAKLIIGNTVRET